MAIQKKLSVKRMSMSPDMLMTGGTFLELFKGYVKGIRVLPWKYPEPAPGAPVKELKFEKFEGWQMAVEVTFQPDEEFNGGEPVVEHYPVGRFFYHRPAKGGNVACDIYFAPSQDGETPAGGDWGDYKKLHDNGTLEVDPEMWGTIIIGACTDAETDIKLSSRSKAAEFLRRSVENGLPEDYQSDDWGQLVGVNGEWERIANDKGAKTLILTNFEGVVEGEGAKPSSASAGTKAGAKATKGKATGKAAAEDTELLERIEEVISMHLSEAKDGTVHKSRLSMVVNKGLSDDREAAKKAIKIVNSLDYLAEAHPWDYDAETGTLSRFE